jgi:hypothetical protein
MASRASTVTVEPQLTLDVGGEVGDFIASEFAFSGTVVSTKRQLEREDEVRVVVTDKAGEVLIESRGWCSKVSLETRPRTPTSPKHTIRNHRVKLEPPPDEWVD